MASLETLRATIQAMERPAGRRTGAVRFGVPETDAALGAKLILGRVHEIAGAAATLFAALTLARCEGPVLWCSVHRGSGHVRSGALHPPGLCQIGLDPERLMLVAARGADELQHAAREGLRAGWHVVVEASRAFDLSSARRLQLAAEEGGGIGLVLALAGSGEGALLPSAGTRWRTGFAEGSPWPAPACLSLSLIRNRAGLPGQWHVEWDHASRSLSVVSAACDRPDRAARNAVA